MAVEFKDYLVNFFLASLFLMCLIGFAVIMGSTHSEPDMFEGYLNTTGLNQTLTEQAESTSAMKTSFQNDNPVIALGEFVISSLWFVVGNIITSVLAFLTFLFDGFQVVFALNPVVLSVITATIVIGIIFAAWRALKQG